LLTPFLKEFAMSQITAPFDAIASAANALAGVMAQLDKDQTAVTTAQQAVTDATTTLTSAQSTLTTDQQAGQTAANTLVTAIAAAGFGINAPSPSNPTPPVQAGT
jgi:peptidoglycan hydrolase CwlO-like protein